MIGNNEMILNEATMIQAVQEWLTKRMPTETPKVRSVSREGEGFKIMLTDEQK